MPRPIKFRRVEFFPTKTYFVPESENSNSVEEITLKFEELEAMRLKDIEKLNQEECAKKMEVSRQTFQNIIDSARNKVARALTEGKAINISGGHYTGKVCKFMCRECGNTYELNIEGDKDNCPKCKSSRVGCNKRKCMCKKYCNK